MWCGKSALWKNLILKHILELLHLKSAPFSSGLSAWVESAMASWTYPYWPSTLPAVHSFTGKFCGTWHIWCNMTAVPWPGPVFGQMIVHCHNLYVSSVTEFLNSLYYCKEPFCRPDTVKLPELLLAPQDTSRLLAFGLGWLGICGGLLACGSGLLAVLQCHL